MTSQNAAYTLRTLLDNIPLKEDPDSDDDVYITTVDVWEGNLYVGTSSAELLHFVSIPPADATEEPSWILASRQQPAFSNEQTGVEKGVRQILILPGPGKACVLCNATLTFYTLPELSPAYGGKIKQAGCTWLGGFDLSTQIAQETEPVIAICLRQRLRLIAIGEKTRKIRDIELGGVDAIQRRGDLACVADGLTYSLLDVVNQRRNELFPVASSSASSAPQRTHDLPQSHPTRQQSRSFSNASPSRLGRGHERNTSLGSGLGGDRLHPGDTSPWPGRNSSVTASQGTSPLRPSSPMQDVEVLTTSSEVSIAQQLPPNIVSPTTEQFLLTTGTRYDEPGVGLFVNLEGDVVRGTIEFCSYPDSLVLDGVDQDAGEAAVAQFVLALVRTKDDNVLRSTIELQLIHDDPAETLRSRQYVKLPEAAQTIHPDQPLLGTGIRTATSRTALTTTDIGRSLRQRRFVLTGESTHTPDADELQRNSVEDALVDRFSAVSAQTLVFTASCVSWIVKASTVTRLSNDLEQAVDMTDGFGVDVAKVQYVINSIRGQDASDELEFVTLTYVRQKGSLLLFGQLLAQTLSDTPVTSPQKQAAASALVEGEIDPRVLLSLLPPLRKEVVLGSQGLWLPQGLLDTITMLQQQLGDRLAETMLTGDALEVLKTYLFFWRKRKGFGSIADEASVFHSVDAALLHILLQLDKQSPPGPAVTGSLRAELNEVLDKGVDCFERAEELCEEYRRLYLLSRLYQSRKMSAQVLATWRRILEGEQDLGGELVDGHAELRKYLPRLRDKALVTEYGTWLANRDARLGAKVFADENARVTFSPTEAVDILKTRAPGAVKDYLEYLVFGKNHVQYINDLITYYLSTILAVLNDPESQATAILLQTSDTYRALQPPKPTFSDFITDNALPVDWWANRLRLLQLIGGSHGAATRYDVHALRTQLESFSKVLVPEMIILNGREGKHEEAIHLLVSGLGDYDTAMRYCLLGGSSIFHPSSSMAAQQPAAPSREEQSRLFQHLLHEFMTINDIQEQVERTSELLARFGGWFDIAEVLQLVPMEWSVEVVSGFLASAFRRLVQERNETSVAKALASAQNLRTNVTMIEKLESLPPSFVTEETTSAVG